jgi:hypothetical protein
VDLLSHPERLTHRGKSAPRSPHAEEQSVSKDEGVSSTHWSLLRDAAFAAPQDEGGEMEMTYEDLETVAAGPITMGVSRRKIP